METFGYRVHLNIFVFSLDITTTMTKDRLNTTTKPHCSDCPRGKFTSPECENGCIGTVIGKPTTFKKRFKPVNCTMPVNVTRLNNSTAPMTCTKPILNGTTLVNGNIPVNCKIPVSCTLPINSSTPINRTMSGNCFILVRCTIPFGATPVTPVTSRFVTSRFKPVTTSSSKSQEFKTNSSNISGVVFSYSKLFYIVIGLIAFVIIFVAIITRISCKKRKIRNKKVAISPVLFNVNNIAMEEV